MSTTCGIEGGGGRERDRDPLTRVYQDQAQDRHLMDRFDVSFCVVFGLDRCYIGVYLHTIV